MGDNKPTKDLTELLAWQASHRLILSIYQITKVFPVEEKFGLTSQIQRAAVSVTSNIAEGYGRFSYKEKVRFYYIAHGSLTEVKNRLIIARDLKYIDTDSYLENHNYFVQSQKLLTGLIKSSKNKMRV